METVVYRKPQSLKTAALSPIEAPPVEDTLVALESWPASAALRPEVFYPSVSEAERDMWTHWLPTAHIYESVGQFAQSPLGARLKQLKAPTDVMEECQWAWKLGMFEAFEVRTPERLHVRDPLVLGCLGHQRYRLALWGESLRPLDEMQQLVQQSLAVRQRAARWRLWSTLSGAALGLGFGLWVASQTPTLGDDVGISIMYVILGTCASLPFQLFTPEEKQQQFLDRYR